jgi:REP element-mobilizing transposase RayT
MKVDPQKHNHPFNAARGRHSIRLQGYDYAQTGAYFVTVVTHQRDSLFGEIINGEMILNCMGKIVREEWFASTNIRKEIRLHPEEFVIMPNHVHGIVWIENDEAITIVGADDVNTGANPINNNVLVGAAPPGRPPLHGHLLPHGHSQMKPRSLGSFIAGFKSSVTKRIRDELNETGIWQRNYYEHIIRNERELNAIYRYIQSNPLNWSEDEENPLTRK